MRTQKGIALPTAMGVLFICSLFAAALLSFSTNSYRLSAIRRDNDRAFNVAEGGLEHAMVKLTADPAYNGEKGTLFSDGKLDIELRKMSAPNYYRVISTGNLPSFSSRTASRRVSAVVEISEKLPAFEYALIARRKLQFQKEVTLDSAPVLGQGHAHSNRDLTLHKDSLVDGNASAVRRLDLKSGATITGDTKRTSAVAFPVIDWAELKLDAIARGSVTGNQIADVSETITLRGFVNGSVRTRGKGKLVVDGLVWVTGRVHLEGLSIDGEGTLIAEGGVTLATNSAQTGLAARPIIFAAPGSAGVLVKKGCILSVGIYAPNAKVTLDGDCQIFGSVAGEMIHVKGKAHITKNTSFGNSGLGPFVIEHYWEEL